MSSSLHHETDVITDVVEGTTKEAGGQHFPAVSIEFMVDGSGGGGGDGGPKNGRRAGDDYEVVPDRDHGGGVGFHDDVVVSCVDCANEENNIRLPSNISTLEQLQYIPSKYRSNDPYRPLRLAHIDENYEEETLDVEESRYALNPLTYSVVIILLVELLERFSFYGVSYTQTTYLTGKYDGEWNAGLTAVEASSYVSVSMALAYTAPFLGAILADSYFGDYWVIVLGVVLFYIPGTFLIALTTFPNRLLGYDLFNLNALSIGLLCLYPIGGGMIKSVVNIFGARQYHPILQSSLIETYYVNFYMCINVGALAGGMIIPFVAQHDLTCAYFIPVIMLVLGLICFLLGSHRYVTVVPPKKKKKSLAKKKKIKKRKTAEEGVVVAMMSPWWSWWSNYVPQVLKSWIRQVTKKTTTKTEEEKEENRTFINNHPAQQQPSTSLSLASSSTSSSSSSSTLMALWNIFQISALVTPFNIAYSQMATTFIVQGTVMTKAFGFIDSPTMNNFDAISVLLCGYVVGTHIYPTCAKYGIKVPTSYKFALGSFLSVLSLSWSLYVEYTIHSSYHNDGKQLCVLWQSLSYVLIGCGEIFAISAAYEAVFLVAPSDQKAMASAINLFFVGGIPNFICIGLYRLCSSWFENSRGIATITTIGDYTSAKVYNYLWVLWCIAVMGTIVNLCPNVMMWLEDLEQKAKEKEAAAATGSYNDVGIVNTTTTTSDSEGGGGGGGGGGIIIDGGGVLPPEQMGAAVSCATASSSSAARSPSTGAGGGGGGSGIVVIEGGPTTTMMPAALIPAFLEEEHDGPHLTRTFTELTKQISTMSDPANSSSSHGGGGETNDYGPFYDMDEMGPLLPPRNTTGLGDGPPPVVVNYGSGEARRDSGAGGGGRGRVGSSSTSPLEDDA